MTTHLMGIYETGCHNDGNYVRHEHAACKHDPWPPADVPEGDDLSDDQHAVTCYDCFELIVGIVNMRRFINPSEFICSCHSCQTREDRIRAIKEHTA